MPSTYTTVQGDMWDMIAYKVYGNEKQMRELPRANERYRHMAVFPAGVTLTCPDAKSAGRNRFLPPWKE